MRSGIVCWCLAVFYLISARWVTGADGKPPARPGAAGTDYKSQLPRVPAPDPAHALADLQLRPGFSAQLVAHEPLVQDPVALDIDEAGRMYVVEFPEYNQYANPQFRGPKNRVKLLVDRDGDGDYDTATLFAENIPLATAVACYDGGVFIGAAPDILYCKDTNGDGIADVRRVVFTGFGSDHAGEGMINSFHWGLDNKFYVSAGTDGGTISRPGNTVQAPLSMRKRTFVFDPRTLQYDYTSGGGQHGMSLDDWGRIFGCGNSDPALLMLYDERYLARNPYMTAPPAAESICSQPADRMLYRLSPVENWRVLRTHLRATGHARGPVEHGGAVAGYFTGGTGVTIYRGDAWPAEYRGNLIVSDVANNVVYRGILAPHGLSLRMHRAEPDVEFVASKNVWFRPVQFANAPDGTLYVIDMARELIEGAAFLPPEILKHIDVASGLDQGRIYRLAPAGFKFPGQPQLHQAKTVDLVSQLESLNGWRRDTAARLLFERQDLQAVASLRQLLRTSAQPLARCHALYLLVSLHSLSGTDLLPLLTEAAHPSLRQHALRLADQSLTADRLVGSTDRQARWTWTRAALQQSLVQLSDDADVHVRYQVAFSAGALPLAQRIPLLVSVLRRDGADPWMQMAVQSSLREGAAEMLSALLQAHAPGAAEWSLPERALLRALALQISARGAAVEMLGALRVIDQIPLRDQGVAREILLALLERARPETLAKFQPPPGGVAARLLTDIASAARAAASDVTLPAPARVTGIRQLVLSPYPTVAKLLPVLLTPQQPQGVQLAAIESFTHFATPEVTTHILEAWGGFSPPVRAHATEMLLSRTDSTKSFLTAIANGTVAPSEVDPVRSQYLQNHTDPSLRKLAQQVFASRKNSARAEVVARYQPALRMPGNDTRGKEVFRKNCAVCHRLENVGNAIGADLTSIRSRGDAAVLLNILDPNREVKPQFLSYVVSTRDGRIHTGMITQETANSLTIRRVDGSEILLLRIDIEELKSTALSFMPEGLEQVLSLQDLADLLAYFQTIK